MYVAYRHVGLLDSYFYIEHRHQTKLSGSIFYKGIR